MKERMYTPDLGAYERSQEAVARIYATDRKEGRWLSLNVAIPRHQIEADVTGEMEKWLTEKKLDEMGAALIRELLGKWDGRDLLMVATRTNHHKHLIEEFRARFDVSITPLRRVPPSEPRP